MNDGRVRVHPPVFMLQLKPRLVRRVRDPGSQRVAQ